MEIPTDLHLQFAHVWPVHAAQAKNHARTHPDPARQERSVHGGLSVGNKIFNLFDVTRQAASAAGKDLSMTVNHRSRSRILKDVSHHHSATNKIPKVRGEVRA